MGAPLVSILRVSKLTVAELGRLCQVPADAVPSSRGPGRPLDPEVAPGTPAAAGDMLVRDGFQNMTLPGVAAAAGVAKTTVYRRYPSTVELVLARLLPLNTGSRGRDT